MAQLRSRTLTRGITEGREGNMEMAKYLLFIISVIFQVDKPIYIYTAPIVAEHLNTNKNKNENMQPFGNWHQW